MSRPFQFQIHVVEHGNRRARIGHIVFSDPATRTSMRVATAMDLLCLLRQAERECDALLFTAQGPVFCSGGNLRDHVQQGPIKGRAANRKIAGTLAALAGLSIPTVGLVEHDALGGGIELLSACDFVVTTPYVLLGFWQRRLGLSFGWGGGARLEDRIGRSRLQRLALEARAVSAQEAVEVGLVDQIVPSWSALADALALCLRLGLLPRESVSAMKKRTAKNERTVFEKLWFRKDHKAALARFSSR